MSIFVLALSRLVPLSFLLSLTLIGSRYAFDLALRSRPELARWCFAGVSLVGLIAMAPYAWRAALIVGAKQAAGSGQWRRADALYSAYDAAGGSRSDELVRGWAYARMNGSDWSGAEEALSLSANPTPQTVLLTGLCQYYEGNPSAERTLRSVPDMTGTQLCIRDYLLGRIAQRRGDLPSAYGLYARSAAWESNFFPSTYHGVRLLVQHGDIALASQILDAFQRRYPSYANDRDIAALRTALRTRTVPADKEFVIVSD